MKKIEYGVKKKIRLIMKGILHMISKKRNVINVLIIIVVAFLVLKVYKINKEPVYIETINGEQFPNLSIYSVHNKKINLHKVLKESNLETSLIFYLSDKCGSCITSLDTISLLSRINSINIILLWKDNVPFKMLENKKIDSSHSFSLKGKYDLERFLPYTYIVNNKDMKVNLKSNYLDPIIIEILNKVDENTLKQAIYDNFKVNNEKDFLLFSINNCENCITTKIELMESGEIDKYSIVTRHDSTQQYDFYDEFGVLEEIFCITSYPTIINLDKYYKNK